MKTSFTHQKDIQPKWYLVNAEGKTLGRLAAKIAFRLRGKHKPTYTPNIDCGDNIIVINAEKIHVTGRKMDLKEYRHHTKYYGHETFTALKDMLAKKPTKALEKAIFGMLPTNRLKREILKKLKIFAGDKHPHEGKKPEILNI